MVVPVVRVLSAKDERGDAVEWQEGGVKTSLGMGLWGTTSDIDVVGGMA